MINGLNHVRNYMTTKEQDLLLQQVDGALWLHDLSRRVQHYGYKYDYRRRIDDDMYVGPLPDWLETIAERLHTDGYMPTLAEQCIINEYEPGQGISAHVDCEPCFGDVICSLSIGGSCMMVFQHNRTGEKREVYLSSGSLIMMSEESRYEWSHSIPARKSDVFHGKRIPRWRRISLTFRTVLVAA